MIERPDEEERVFVSDDSGIRKGRLDKDDIRILESVKTGEGLIAINSVDELRELARAAGKKFQAYEAYVREHLTQQQATFIRKLRVDEGYSWRAVARACYNQRWDGWLRWDPPSNQIAGMVLCLVAAEFHGENHMKPPWN